MLGPLSQRLLTLLQLTRMALVFTAISNGACEVLLAAKFAKTAGHESLPFDIKSLAAMAAVSIGLYGFGMSLNDIIDRRRDTSLASHRPLPSGRIRLVTAHTICVCLALLACWGAAAYARWNAATGPYSLAVMFITLGFIVFYDFAGKYLVALGLISLGLIRFMQASIAAPLLPVVWHPLLLLNHVTILSAVCYHWEQKRPSLTPKHWGTVIGGLVGVDAAAIGLLAYHRGGHTPPAVASVLRVGPQLLPAAVAVLAFIVVALIVRKMMPNSRVAGQSLMLYGLLWLIVYDAAIAAGYVGVVPAAALLCLLPIAWWSVQLMRWWSKVVSLSHRPVYQRART